MKVIGSIKINKSKKLVMALIRSPKNLEKFHPYCKQNEIEIWNESKSVDWVHYYSGKSYKRIFKEWDKNGYILDIYENKKLATIMWKVIENNENSYMNLIAVPYLPYKYKIFNLLVFHLFVKYVLKNYLNSVLKGLKFHIETNNIVRMDQFGRHIWYSS